MSETGSRTLLWYQFSTSACNGQLAPKGSGASGSPIIIDQYGAGAPPLINGNGLTEGAVYLVNQSYWTIQNIKVTNNAATEARRSGVLIKVTDAATYAGITLRNLNVHDVKGTADRVNRFNDFYISAGIMVHTPGTGRINGLTIEGNTVHDLIGGGIKIFGDQDGNGNTNANYHTNVIVRNNTVSRVATDGIVVCMSDGPLVEYNMAYDLGTNSTVNTQYIAGIWTWNTRNATFQYNEVARTQPSGDSEAWDCDGFVSGTCLYQYNYSHDNAGGMYLHCYGCAASTQPVTVVLRYNIAQNDCRINDVAPSVPITFYNNVLYCPGRLIDMPFTANSQIYNNIFVGNSGSFATGGGRLYDSNVFSGFSGPAGSNAIAADPLFVDPGKGADGISTVAGYKLAIGSPALGNGKIVLNNGGKDFYGNVVSASAAPNRGAYQGAGLPANTGPVSINDAVTGTGTNQFNYSSGWGSSSGDCPSCFNGDNHWSNVSNATYQVVFTGTRIKLYTSVAPNNGKAAIAIDGGTETLVDLYAASISGNQLVFTSAALASGAHTLRVRVTGTQNTSATGSFVSADRVEVSAATAPPPTSSSVNDAVTGTGTNQFNYSSGWGSSSGDCPSCFNGDNHWSNVSNATYQVAFTGTRIKLYTSMAPNNGKAAIAIDGGTETLVDLYAASISGNQLAFTSAALASGAHTLRVRVTGTQNTSATGSFVSADRVEVTN